MQTIGQNQTAQALIFGPIVATDGVTPITGLVSGTNLTVTLSKNGAAFGAPAGAVSEVGNGYYAIAGNAADAGALGPLIVHWATTGQPASIASETAFMVVAYDPLDANALGLAYVAATNTSAAAIDAALPGNFGALAISDSGEVTAAGGGGATPAQIWAYLLAEASVSGSFGAALAAALIQQAAIAPLTVAQSSLVYRAAVGDWGGSITDTLLTLNGAAVEMTTVASVEFVVAQAPGSSPAIGPTAATVNGNGTVTYTFAESDLEVPAGRYQDLRWVATLVGGGQVTCIGALWATVSVEGAG